MPSVASQYTIAARREAPLTCQPKHSKIIQPGRSHGRHRKKTTLKSPVLFVRQVSPERAVAGSEAERGGRPTSEPREMSAGGRGLPALASAEGTAGTEPDMDASRGARATDGCTVLPVCCACGAGRGLLHRPGPQWKFLAGSLGVKLGLRVSWDKSPTTSTENLLSHGHDL